ncbi:MAG: MYG1 family protein [archaeon]
METIAIHNGKFHADDVFSVAILKLIYPNLKIVRTRDPDKLSSADARIDVGGKYNHETKDYDHHQPEFKKTRKNKIPYASAGLIWEHYGPKLVDKEAWQIIEEKIIQYIDADDNGIKTHKAETIEPYSLREIIVSFNPEWPNRTEENYNKNFNEATDFAMAILKKEIELANTLVKVREIIKEKIAQTDKEYLILDENMPFQEAVREESKKIKFVIKKDPVDDVWAAIGVKKYPNRYEVRKDFPKSWAGLTNSDLAKASNIKDAVFCHKKLFIFISQTKEGVIKAAELALKE